MALTDENTNGFYMPVAPAYNGGGFGNGGFGGDWGWIVLLLLLAGGGWGNGFGGGFGGYGNMMLGYDFPWLLNGQNGINNNISDGFRDAQLHDSVTSVRDGINALATQLCGCCGDMQMALANGFNGVAQQSFALQSQIAQNGYNNSSAIADLKYTVATEACADRQAVSDALRDVLTANTAATQRILDQLCQDKIDAKNDQIAQLRQELMFARGQASQDVQTATLRAGQIAEVDALYDRLNSCPVPTTPVYGRQPIFTCNNGCGCGNGAF